ncbi:hypothetical protein [Capnocytophaga gingivalis]|uniref:hypothetical protein n=1 Tax=Capnocytophaga gingivalis TaxID=1017 RepID=UPI0028D6581E|nr:hypothetical protein [Capnocytophaga gingivalis]
MGVITENHSMVGLRGDVGKIFVYKQRDGKTIVLKVPKKISKSSNIQAAHRNRFKKPLSTPKRSRIITLICMVNMKKWQRSSI